MDYSVGMGNVSSSGTFMDYSVGMGNGWYRGGN